MHHLRLLIGLSSLALYMVDASAPIHAQSSNTTAAATNTSAASDLLTDDQLEVLVARIALYPDDLVAAISAASLFPLQIVEASRFLDTRKSNPKLEPKAEWDGSVISLLNYPDVVKMMSDDLEWTQSLANALTTQQKDVLIAIQQLRDQAVAKNIIKTDDKITIVNENDNVIIRPTNPEKVYIPQYQPEMLYEPSYAAAPVSYYPEPYDNYYYPGAAFFAAAATGVAWAAIVNWDDWGVWGGRWNGDVDIDCNNCLNGRNFNGKMNLNDVDWKNVDRSKIGMSRDQFAKMDRSTIKSSLAADGRNKLSNRAGEARGGTAANRMQASDIRKQTAQGLKSGQLSKSGNRATTNAGPGAGKAGAAKQKAAANRGAKGPSAGARPNNKAKMASRPDNRSRQSSALGNVQSGRRESIASQRGAQSMRHSRPSAPRASQHRSRPIPQGGGRGGGRGGGGRGGRR